MKTKQVPDKPHETHRFLMRIPNSPGGNAGLDTIRAYANREAYKVRVEYDGPRRDSMKMSTRKADATGYRIYFDDRGKTPEALQKAKLVQENYRLKKELTQIKRALCVLHGVISSDDGDNLGGRYSG